MRSNRTMAVAAMAAFAASLTAQFETELPSAHTAAVALMRSWLARQIDAGKLEPDRELAAELK